MSQFTSGASLQASIQLNAAPVFSFETNPVSPTPTNPFSIGFDMLLEYDMLATMANGFLAGRRFNLSEGFLAKHIVLTGCRFLGAGGKLAVQVAFTGSFNGSVYLSGTPVYNSAIKHLELQNVSYDVESSNLLLKSAKWIFNKVILEEIKKRSAIDLTSYVEKALANVQIILNKEWTPGVETSGTVSGISISEIKAQNENLLLRTVCTGTLAVRLSPTLLPF